MCRFGDSDRVDGVPDTGCDNRNVKLTALFVKATAIRANPDPTSTLVATAPAGSLYPNPCGGEKEGWRRVIQPERTHRGWALVPTTDLIRDDWQSTLLRKERAEKSTWPPSVKRSVIRKRVRIGFTVSRQRWARPRRPRRWPAPLAEPFAALQILRATADITLRISGCA